MGNDEVKKVLVLLFMTFAFCSCKKDLYQRVNRYMEAVEENDSAELKMVELYPTPWDTMYVLEPGIMEWTIRHQIGQDIERRIVFVKEGTVIYEEKEIAVGKPYKVTFLFEGKVAYYTPETAIFSAKKLFHHKIKKHYHLTPIGENHSSE